MALGGFERSSKWSWGGLQFANLVPSRGRQMAASRIRHFGGFPNKRHGSIFSRSIISAQRALNGNLTPEIGSPYKASDMHTVSVGPRGIDRTALQSTHTAG